MVFLLTFQDEMKVTKAYRNYLALIWEKASQRRDLLGNLCLPPSVEVLAGTCPSSRGLFLEAALLTCLLLLKASVVLLLKLP